MVSLVDSGLSLSGAGSSPGRGHCVVFLGKSPLLSQCLSPSRYFNGTGQFNTGGRPAPDCAATFEKLLPWSEI